jgi:hypothetical protein
MPRRHQASTAAGTTPTKAKIGHELAQLMSVATMPVHSVGDRNLFTSKWVADGAMTVRRKNEMFRSLLALLVILLAAPAFAGSRLGGFHSGFPVFHPSGRPVVLLFGGYFCGYNCGWGFYNPAYGYFNNYGYGFGYPYGSRYSNSYFNNYYGYLDLYGNGDGKGYGSTARSAVSISNGLTGAYVPDPVGADIPPMIIPRNCWVRRAAYDPSGAYFGKLLINLCRTQDNVRATGSRTLAKMPETNTGSGQPSQLSNSAPANLIKPPDQ